MDAKSVAFLFAPCITFIAMALMALYCAAGYTDMATGRVAVANIQRFESQIDEMAHKIVTGEQEPSREYVMRCLRKSEAISSAWRDGVTASAWSLRRIGYGVLFGIVAQCYVILRLRAHYKKLAGGATRQQSSIGP
jgi:hypothetical protein